MNASEIISVLKSEIADFDRKTGVQEGGTVVRVGDGIATVYGMQQTFVYKICGCFSFFCVYFSVHILQFCLCFFDTMRNTGCNIWYLRLHAERTIDMR